MLPRYARLADATAAFDLAARGFCAAPATAPFDEVRSAFHAAADAWHDVEHIRFGPMESRLRAERLYFWPDPRNATARQLADLLSGRDPAVLTAEGFVRASAAVQGLPAAERLLFDEGAAAAFRRQGDEGRRRCEVLVGDHAERRRDRRGGCPRVERGGHGLRAAGRDGRAGERDLPGPEGGVPGSPEEPPRGARAGRESQAHQAPRGVARGGAPDCSSRSGGADARSGTRGRTSSPPGRCTSATAGSA